MLPDQASELLSTSTYQLFSSNQATAVLLLMQPLKFGTICFFVISGFLLGKNLKQGQSPWSYYKRRLRVVGIPFLVAVTLFYLKSVGFNLFIGKLFENNEGLTTLITKLWRAIFYTTYWFIANFLAALGILLLCWRYARTTWFGWVTAAIPFIYAINVYTLWFEPRHIFAVPAYVFYLWLGVYLSRKPAILDRLQHLSSFWSTIAVIATLTLALGEAYYLMQSSSIDPANSLRLTNQLFSLSVFVWLLRHNWLNSLPFLNPRDESFGIYLYHLFFVAIVSKAYLLIPALNALNYQLYYTGWQLAGYHILRFVMVYLATLIFVKVINQTRFKWLMGNH